MGSSDQDLHGRHVPGFLCFRTWDITRKKLVRNTVGQQPDDFIDADDRNIAREVGRKFAEDSELCPASS